MILSWWPAWRERERAAARAELLGVLRFVRLPFLVALAHRHGLHGFNPHKSLHRLIVPPEPVARRVSDIDAANAAAVARAALIKVWQRTVAGWTLPESERN